QRRALDPRQGAQRQLVGGFRVQPEQEGAGEGVGQQRHPIIPASDQTGDCRVTQDELKTLVGQAALKYVVPGEIVGVGTGSTVNKFIEALASMKDRVPGAVSSSNASTERLRAIGIRVFDANEVGELAVYIDGADA